MFDTMLAMTGMRNQCLESFWHTGMTSMGEAVIRSD
jgi:hypothetical protein